MASPIRVGIVVGEASGDILGAGLIRSLKARYPTIQFEGMAGPKMMAEGMSSMFPMDRLSVMGLIEPLKRLPELLHIRKSLRHHFLHNPPDVFIGIDAPDFNLSLELALKAAGIKTAHYVSPSVWAWRQNRVFKIKKAVDTMLCLLPFEVAFYERFNVPARFIGHPLATELDAQPLRDFGASPVIALMPGSRRNEVELMADIYIETAQYILQQLPQATFVLPAANDSRKQELDIKAIAWAKHHPKVYKALTISEDNSHQVMAASDFVICTSGTTALEAMLLAKPMLIAYRMHWLSYKIIRSMMKVKYIGLPNLLVNRFLVPEFEQNAVTSEALSAKALEYLRDKDLYQQTVATFNRLHHNLDLNASEKAADAIAELINANR